MVNHTTIIKNRNKSKKLPKQKQVHAGMKTKQTKWECQPNTFTLSLDLVPFGQLYAMRGGKSGQLHTENQG